MERIRLPNCAGVSGAPITGWPALLFGLPFVATWLLIRFAAVGKIAAFKPAKGVPPFLIDTAAWAFGLVGLYLVALGIAGLSRNARRRRLLRERPDEPWLADHAWAPEKVRDDTWRRVRRALFGMALFAFLMTPLNWWGFFSDRANLFVQIISGVFDLIGLYAIYHTGVIVVRALRFGSSTARPWSFPAFLGGDLDVTLHLNADVRQFDRLDVTLRCIEEVYETSGHGDNKSTRVVCYQIHGETRTFDTPANLVTTDGSIAFSFKLPDDGKSTRLSARPARFWELEVKGERPGVDFLAAFMMPVYSRGPASKRRTSPQPTIAPIA
ncbi:MAG: hypothetical protein O7E54_05280 [Planctomycetota bacterium]|nr:hypothetical protein [Planctomycetota bacterium]